MRSNLKNWEDFMQSNIWKDMQDEYSQWLKDLHMLLEDPSGDTPDKVLHRAGGAAEAVRNMLKMPMVTMKNINLDRETEEEDDE